MTALLGAIYSGADIVQHAVGWLEGGLTASYEKMFLDAELLQLFVRRQTPVETSEEEFGIGAMSDVGLRGRFFGTQHTQDRYQDAFYAPLPSDWNNSGPGLNQGQRTHYSAQANWLTDCYATIGNPTSIRTSAKNSAPMWRDERQNGA